MIQRRIKDKQAFNEWKKVYRSLNSLFFLNFQTVFVIYRCSNGAATKNYDYDYD